MLVKRWLLRSSAASYVLHLAGARSPPIAAAPRRGLARLDSTAVGGRAGNLAPLVIGMATTVLGALVAALVHVTLKRVAKELTKAKR
jgi:hypothetical protein